jgi:hypothetical protein
VKISAMKKEVLNPHQVGKEFEDLVFQSIRHALQELETKNSVVFSGLKLKEYRSRTIGEIDFLIFSQQLKAVIQVFHLLL